MDDIDGMVAAYVQGSYDGYWGCHTFEGPHTNVEWTKYLRGWLAGHRDRINGPSDQECAAFAEQVAATVQGGAS